MILFGIYNSLLFNGFYQKSFRFYIFFEASVAEISEIYFLLNIVNYQLELVFFLPCTCFCNNQTFGNEPPFLEVSNYKLFLEKKNSSKKSSCHRLCPTKNSVSFYSFNELFHTKFILPLETMILFKIFC